MIYSDLVDEFPPEMREPVLRLIDHLRTDLSDSPTRADFQKLVSLVEIQGENIGALAIAQKRTEERIEQLVEAQTKSEKRLTGLEAVVNKLVEEAKTIRKEAGGLSPVLGYKLEDEAIWALPKLLLVDHSIEVQGGLRRGFLTLFRGKTLEVNIHGQAARAGRTLTILGEAKTQLKKKDVDNFLQLVRLVSLGTDHSVFPLLITYQTSPPVEEYARDNGVAVYFSYQFRPS